MILDDGKMESMLEKYFDAPCIKCCHMQTDYDRFERLCPFFENGIIPDNIVSGENLHTTRHPIQIKEGVFIERDWKSDR